MTTLRAFDENVHSRRTILNNPANRPAQGFVAPGGFYSTLPLTFAIPYGADVESIKVLELC
jgi:hypothetical protein